MSTIRANALEMLDGRGKGAITFDNVQEMVDSTVLAVGQKVRTLGYNAPGDGGGNDYVIVAAATGADDGGSFIDLSGSGLQAKGLFPSGVNVKQFGAPMDGVTDDTSFVQATANYSKVFSIPEGDVVLSTLSLDDHAITGAGIGKTRVTQTGTSTSIFDFSGSIGSQVDLSANAIIGDTQLSVTDASSFSVGDFIVLTDNVSYNPNDSTYKNGEMLRVVSVDTMAGTLGLEGGVRGTITAGSYTTTNSAGVRRLSMASKPSINGLSVIGDDTTTTAICVFQFCENPAAKDIEVVSGGHYGVRFHTCWAPMMKYSYILYLKDDIGNGHVGYGVLLSGASDSGIISDNYFSKCRHGVTTIGGGEGYPHNIVVSNNVCVDTFNAALDTHAAGNGILIDGNTVDRSDGFGISVRSINTKVSNNLVKSPGIHGIGVNETIAREVEIENNTVLDAFAHGITVEVDVDSIRIAFNRVNRPGADGIRHSGLVSNLIISDNEVKAVGSRLTDRDAIVALGSGTQKRLVARNFIIATTGSCRYGIRDALTESWYVDNKLTGTFSTAAVSLSGGATDLRNDILA